MRPDPKPILAGLALVMAFGTQASAETVRTEYRYPDRPDLAYVGGGKAYTLSDASPMAFSTFEAAISKEDAKRLLDQNGYESQLPKRMPAPQSRAEAPPPRFAPYQPATADDSYSTSEGFVIQAGAFGSYDNARRLSDQLSGFGATRISEDMKNGKPLYRVYLGGWASKRDAQPTLNLIKSNGFDGFVTKAS